MDLWLLIVIPFLILLAPRLIKHLLRRWQFASSLLRYRNRSEKRTLHAEIIEIRKELSQINQVDQFAKFARAQRKLRTATDQLNSLSRQDLELNIKYVLLGQALVWLLAVIFSFRLVYQTYTSALSYLGYDYREEEKVFY